MNHPTYSRTNIIVRTSLVRASDVIATAEKIQAFAAKTFPPELTVRVTGELILHTFSTVGKPVFYTSVVLFLGFLTLCVSSFVPIREFGLLAAASMVVALAADVILLPAILSTTRIITLWDLLYLKLGRDPHKAIPLFDGLRPLQAKIVTLMGELKVFPKNEAIVHQGQMGSEMYVLLKGSADIFIEANGVSKRIAGLERGDVFGEMGLVRHHERTADVVATEDVELLAVNERFLSRVKRRYPRIGAQIFFNVAKILSDRLEEARRVPPT